MASLVRLFSGSPGLATSLPVWGKGLGVVPSCRRTVYRVDTVCEVSFILVETSYSVS